MSLACPGFIFPPYPTRLVLNAEDAIPRISWGSFKEDNGKIIMPLAVQVHHGLADGCHLGKFFNRMQELVNGPAKLFETGLHQSG